jgi:glycosyltransferase 2 family protein
MNQPLSRATSPVRSQPRSGRRRSFWLICKLTISVSLLALLLTNVDLDESWRVVAGARLELVALMLALAIGNRFFAAYRWFVLVRVRQPSVSLAGIIRLIFVSGFIGYFMPGSVGVELVRVYGLARTTADRALSVTSVLVERVLAMLALAVLVLIGLPFQPPAMPGAIGAVAWGTLALLLIAVVLPMTSRVRRLSLSLVQHPRLAFVRGGLGKLYLVLDEYRGRPWLMSWAMLLAIAFQLMRCLAPAVGAAALGAPLPFIFFVALMPVIMLLALVPISIAGLGVQEAGFVYLFGLLGMPVEVALPLALLIRLFTVMALLPGAWFYLRRGVYA